MGKKLLSDVCLDTLKIYTSLPEEFLTLLLSGELIYGVTNLCYLKLKQVFKEMQDFNCILGAY